MVLLVLVSPCGHELKWQLVLGVALPPSSWQGLAIAPPLPLVANKLFVIVFFVFIIKMKTCIFLKVLNRV